VIRQEETMCKVIIGVAGIAILATVAALAIEGKNGYEASEVFVWGEVRDSIDYPDGFDGVEYGDLPASGIGPDNSNWFGGGEIAASSSGDWS
jgi:hypothetical protein